MSGDSNTRTGYNRRVMPPSALFLLAVVLIAAILLIATRIRADLVALLTLVALALSGVVSPAQAFAGFGSTAVITILAIFIISEAMHQTGLTLMLGQRLLRFSGGGEKRAILFTALAGALLSLFMNNLAAAGVLLPAVISLSRHTRTAPSRLLMPLAFGTILGGMATLLTTANIVVSGTLRESGLEPFNLLSFLPIGIPIIVAGTAYLTLAGRRLLPERYPAGQSARAVRLRAELEALYGIERTLCEVRVQPGSALAGMSLRQGEWAARLGLTVVGLARDGHMMVSPSPDEIIQEGDVVLAQGMPQENVLTDYGLRLQAQPEMAHHIANGVAVLGEIVLSPRTSTAGKTLRELHFRETYGLNVLALWRRNKPVVEGISEMPLEPGDALLVQGSAARFSLLRDQRDFLLLEEDPDAILRPRKARLAAVITLVTLVMAAMGWLPVSVATLAGAALLMLTRCVSMDDGYRAIEWKAIFLIAGMWPLGTALVSTGLADIAADALLRVTHGMPALALAAILLLTAGLLSQVIGGQVAVPILLAPVAVAIGHGTGADPRGLAMAVALGSSLGFLTPVGHPVNTLVMGPGGYTSRDFLRVGGLLLVILVPIILAGLHLFWKL
ncbi:MAG: SLC13 family permease [Chloroflexi bacterium]|nr:SLC13 family permease [Chloroflexota bacterium]